MKRNLLAILCCLSATLIFNKQANAQGTLIHYWNFNTFTTAVTLPAIAHLNADFSLISSPMAALVYQPQPGTSSAFSDYCDPYTAASIDYDTVNVRMSAPSGNAFRARNPSDSMEILLFMPTTGYVNLQLKFGLELSSTTNGDSANIFAYSVDSGTTWITSGTGLSEWADHGDTAFRLISVHISDVAAYNNPGFVFRITTMGRNTGTAGNNRYDNISLDGDLGNPVLNVAQVTNIQPVYTLYPNPASEKVEINSNLGGDKTIVITNVVGQTVFSGNETGTHASINTANLNSGLYCISIRENNSGSLTTLKFVKQ